MLNKKRFSRFAAIGGALSIPLTLSACAGPHGETVDSTGTAASASELRAVSIIPQSEGISQVHYVFERVDCETGAGTGEVVEDTRDLEDFTIPGGIPELENSPLDKDSAHLFADSFMTLAQGCYDVTATPLLDGEPSETCKAATRSGVEVEPASVTEIWLINQCEGEDPGAIDAIATLNHEPEIQTVEFEESKFEVCGDEQIVCATVIDPDNDPLEFVWTLSDDAPPASGPTVVSRSQDPDTNAMTECVEFIPKAPGKYEVSLEVYDLVHQDGELVRIQDVTEEGHESHANFDFFFYAVDPSAGHDGAAGAKLEVSVSTRHHAADLLILEPTLSSATVVQNEADSLGLTYDIVDAPTWAAMTAADFAEYRAIVLADPNCSAGTSAITAAEANVATWSAAVSGNVILIGTDEVLHSAAGGAKLVSSGLDFATSSDPGETGAYVSLSCYYNATAAGTAAPVLDGFGPSAGSFTVTGVPGCFNDAHIVASHPATSTLTDADLAGWGCSVHEAFDSWAPDFEVLAIAELAGGPYAAGDGTVGTPYILARGVLPEGCGNGELNPGEACDDGNNDDGDGCDAACNVEECGNGIQQAGEGCDDGNTDDGDGCAADCEKEGCFIEEDEG